MVSYAAQNKSHRLNYIIFFREVHENSHWCECSKTGSENRRYSYYRYYHILILQWVWIDEALNILGVLRTGLKRFPHETYPQMC